MTQEKFVEIAMTAIVLMTTLLQVWLVVPLADLPVDRWIG